MNTTLRIAIHQVGARVPLSIFQLEGDIDAESCARLQEAAVEAHRNGMSRLLLDLSGVAFMGSAGLRALHTIDEMLRKGPATENDTEDSDERPAGGFKSPYLKILNPTGSVVRTLKISGFEMIFDIYHDRQAAIDAFDLEESSTDFTDLSK